MTALLIAIALGNHRAKTHGQSAAQSVYRVVLVGAILIGMAAMAAADDAKNEAIQKDRKMIEGKWRAVSVVFNGFPLAFSETRKIVVVNGADGSWSLQSDGQPGSRGTSEFDPTVTPKTIDFTVTEGDAVGNTYFGIYELGEKKRKLCFAPPGASRPTEFSSTDSNQHVLIEFERE